MHYYPEDQSEENLKKLIQTNVCVICGRQLAIYIDSIDKRRFIACSGQIHEGIAREYQPQSTDYRSEIRRETELEQKAGTDVAKRLAHIPKHGQLTRPDAEYILSLVYPGCPREEIVRCAILCRDFGLHPLMKEVYLIPFKDKGGKENYVTVLGINATRKLMALRGSYSYVDDTPRLMTNTEQKRIFGEVDENNIVAITKLQTKDGLEAPGYGRWPKDKQPYGTDKGNTKANMAFIRSERNAFGRLSPDALPPDVEIVDEAYVKLPEIGEVDLKTGEIKEEKAVEGEFTEVPPEEQPEPEAEVEQAQASKSLIDLDWLKESLKGLVDKGQTAYAEKSLLGYMRSSYKGVEGDSVSEIASNLDKGQATHFARVIQDALDKA